jgi:hypothetical protein
MNALQTEQENGAIIEQVMIAGDLSKLTPQQRSNYYMALCGSLGLNPMTKPFDYINLNGKLTLYAKRDAGDQLRKLYGISIAITDKKVEDGIFYVTAKATDKFGRSDEDMGAVNIAGLKGDALANASLKAITKAKRRVTLSICGLGILDESEVESIIDMPDNKATAKIRNLKEKLRPVESIPETIEPAVEIIDEKKQRADIINAMLADAKEAGITTSEVLRGIQPKTLTSITIDELKTFINSKVDAANTH